jgi:hypothetical protein
MLPISLLDLPNPGCHGAGVCPFLASFFFAHIDHFGLKKEQARTISEKCKMTTILRIHRPFWRSSRPLAIAAMSMTPEILVSWWPQNDCGEGEGVPRQV